MVSCFLVEGRSGFILSPHRLAVESGVVEVEIELAADLDSTAFETIFFFICLYIAIP